MLVEQEDLRDRRTSVHLAIWGTLICSWTQLSAADCIYSSA